MITSEKNLFSLNTKSTTYAFAVTDTGHLEHLHYGRKIHAFDGAALREKHAFAAGNSVSPDQEHLNITLEDFSLEFSSYGKGDIREPFVEMVHADGSSTCDFRFDSFEIVDGGFSNGQMPVPHGQCQSLILTLKDKSYNQTLKLYYSVYEDSDVILRSASITNDSQEEVFVTRLLSGQLDFADTGYSVLSFHGAWAREMDKDIVPVGRGKYVGGAVCGTSSNRCNPLFFITRETTTETSGEVYGCNLIYSGNHYEAVECSSHFKTRAVWGMNPSTTRIKLEAGQELFAPCAVMTYSKDGYNKVSQNFHDFVNNNIVREAWANKVRPILLNSWEAAYFDFDENKLMRLAKEGKACGIELFVMDDGWFGERNDDKRSLGDWNVNYKKLPGGLKGIADKVNALGMDFGLWVEPEMVNADSDLYRSHPDWTIEIPGKHHAEGRNQRMLDLANPAVCEYIIDAMTKVFSSANISYVKWDMNRILSDSYSQYLPADRQGELDYRYYEGFYYILKTLFDRFPNILFEGCASGGNRFDLGMLCFFPQIWASDNTDAVSRLSIMDGYSYGYPQSTFTAHVSLCPNHQTLRTTPLSTRFNVAAFGVLGYECNLCDMSASEKEEIKNQIELYKQWRELLQFGRFYRGCSGNNYSWTIASKDKTHAVGMIMQKLVNANFCNGRYSAFGLGEDKRYLFTNLPMKYNIKNFGDLINTVSPIHIRQDSLAHKIIAKVYKMDGETEQCTAYGDALMYSGVKLKQAFAGTGYSDEVRYYQDFCSRIYFMEQIDEEASDVNQ